MGRTIQDKPARKRPNSRRALVALRRMRRHSLLPHLQGKPAEEIIREIKKTREQIWQEKLAPRP